MIHADVNQVTLVLRNVLHNAIKFSQQNSCVSVKTTSQNNFCKINICDTGMGMTADEIHLLLNSNDYFTKTGTEKEKGTGLGFVLCKHLSKRNDGQMPIESRQG